MGLIESCVFVVWMNLVQIVCDMQFDYLVMVFVFSVLCVQVWWFLQGFLGFVIYVVKVNFDRWVICMLVLVGIMGFDVVFLVEIDLIGWLVFGVVWYYYNLVWLWVEIDYVVVVGVGVWLVDCLFELEKLCVVLLQVVEIVVCFKLLIKGVVYDFGLKFGVMFDFVVELLWVVVVWGYLFLLIFYFGM